MQELTEGLFNGATAAPTSSVNVPTTAPLVPAAVSAMPEAPTAGTAADEMDESDVQAMRARLQAL